MPKRPGLPLAAVVPLLPVLAVQGRLVRRVIPRLPDADGPTAPAGPEALSLLVVGDSVAAGVGLAHQQEGIAGRLAERLSARTGRPASWRVLAKSGLTAGEVLDLLGDGAALREADAVVVSVGVNDAKDMHTSARWSKELRELLGFVSRSAPGAQVVLVGLPDFGTFRALPQPLRWVLRGRGRRLDAAGQKVAAEFTRVRRVELGDLPPVHGDAFAPDGFHPSAAVHDAIAAVAADVLLPSLATGG